MVYLDDIQEVCQAERDRASSECQVSVSEDIRQVREPLIPKEVFREFFPDVPPDEKPYIDADYSSIDSHWKKQEPLISEEALRERFPAFYREIFLSGIPYIGPDYSSVIPRWIITGKGPITEIGPNIVLVDEATPIKPRCDCGAEVTRTTHAQWCSKIEGCDKMSKL